MITYSLYDQQGKYHCDQPAHTDRKAAYRPLDLAQLNGPGSAYRVAGRPDRKARRHRIEHCTLVDQDLIDRMAKMNICPSVNAGLVFKLGANYAKFYGPERNKYLGALKSMMEAGIKCSLHSDAPSGPCGLECIDGAVNRYDHVQNVQCDRTQAVSVMDAIRCATINGAYSSYEENIKGSLEVGKDADITVWDDDFNALMTIVKGTTVYKK